MSKTFKLELKIVLTDEQQQKLVEAARTVYAAAPPSVRYKGESSRGFNPEEFIDGSEGALTYVIEQNTLLDELHIRGDVVSCTDVDHEGSDDPGGLEDDVEEDAPVANLSTDEEDLDEWEEGLYLCRWPNGEFSVVEAAKQTRRAGSIG